MKKMTFLTFFISLLLFGGLFVTADVVLPKKLVRAPEKISDEDLGKGNVIEQRIDNELLFLVAGIDDDGSQEWSRTDSLILVHVNFENGSINLISIPRDTYVYIDEEHGYDKVNHAHAFGGMKLTMRTLREFLGIDLDYYVQFNFESVKHIVDALGGVEVDVPVPIYHWASDVDLKPGRQRIDGKEALMFARYRKGYEDGDLGRMRAQQQLIVQTIKEALKAPNLPKLPVLLDIYYQEVHTNLSIGFIRDLLPMLSQFGSGSFDTAVIPGEPMEISEIYYYRYDEPETQALMDRMLADYKIHPVAHYEEEAWTEREPGVELPFEEEDDVYWPEETEAPVYDEEPEPEPTYEEPDDDEAEPEAEGDSGGDDEEYE